MVALVRPVSRALLTGGSLGQAKALQWLLTHSFSGRALAVRGVTGNQGKDTAGVDGAVWRSPHAKYNAIFSLSATTSTPRVHSESQWKVKAARYSDDEGSSYAGFAFARTRPGCRDPGH
jgi:N-terminal domain of reverse transcriptase